MIPTYDADLFTDEALSDPYEHYRRLRELGPVVWLDRHDMWALPRHREVREALSDPASFCSGNGVGLNPFINELGRGTTLMSDGEAHRRQRDVIGRPLTPKALGGLRPELDRIAVALVDRLVERGSFDAVGDLAEVIPATWVPDLLGWPENGRDKLLAWGSANFDALGPMNPRCDAAGALLTEMATYAHKIAHSGEIRDGSIAAGIVRAADRGDIAEHQCALMIIDYLAPSLDTTISALGNAVWLFATHPEQWDMVRADPTRVKQAFEEILRFESPISCFTRVVTADRAIGGTELRAGSRVLMMYASANRDERRWKHADRFDVTRDTAGHVAFGHGPHACAGMGLARLEGAAVLTALAHRVERFELTGTPIRKLNNLIRAFSSIPVTVHGADDRKV
jgi:cytochrome P450